MLEILQCSSPEAKREWLDTFDPTEETWIVSDLQSKWHLQERLLNENGVLEQSAILRATELWKHLAFQQHPELKILSTELAQTLFWNWIEPMNLPWARSPLVVPNVLREMQMWISVFANPNFEEIMAGWFTENPESYVRWGTWFELCSNLWQRCQEEGWIMVSWLPGVLLAGDLSKLHWQKRLTFDLGPQVSQVEGLLIKELSRHLEVRLIFPVAPWVSLMPSPVRPYDDLLAQPYKGDPNWQPLIQESINFGRFSTQLAEVKDTVARVRGWLDQGVAAKDIAIVAPDIEHYWPVLNLFLQQEGIPASKNLSEKLGGFHEMAHWIATLRIRLQKVSSVDLETYFFAKDEPILPFDEFRVLFTNVYDAMDLRRAEILFNKAKEIAPQDSINIFDFMAWALLSWSKDQPDQRVVALMQILAQEVPRSLLLIPSQWLSYVEGLLVRRELKLADGAEDGIVCVSVSSAGWVECTHAVFLNLSESALRSVENSPVTPGEMQKIFTDTGFSLGVTDRQELEFEFLWFLQRPWKNLQLNFSATDFEGQTLTPSRFWIWAGFINDKLKTTPDLPMATRWDEVQRSVDSQNLNLAFQRDQDVNVSSWQPVVEERFSASSLERYMTCPFIFAAQRRLKLNDDPVMDLDLDRRTRGQLLHMLLEKLTDEPFKFDRSETELLDMIEACRIEGNLRLGDPRLWPALRTQHLRLARQFLNFEKQWRGRFPETKTVGRETAFEGFWNLDTKAPQAEETSVKFSGRLDRVDSDADGRYALIDYKASGNHSNWKSWASSHHIQMPFYSMLLEQGLAGLPAGEVVASNFYVVKDEDRRKGFHLKDEGAALYDGTERHYNFIQTQEKVELFNNMREQINAAVEAILGGQLQPVPEDFATCEQCRWRGLCRAPHLS